MKKIILMIALTLFAVPAFAYSTSQFNPSGTVTTGALATITLPAVSNDILVLNDSTITTESFYVDFTGTKTVATITNESAGTGGHILKYGEFVGPDGFRTNKVKSLAKSGSPAYRVFVVY